MQCNQDVIHVTWAYLYGGIMVCYALVWYDMLCMHVCSVCNICSAMQRNALYCNVMLYYVCNVCNACNVCNVCNGCNVCNVGNVCMYWYGMYVMNDIWCKKMECNAM